MLKPQPRIFSRTNIFLITIVLLASIILVNWLLVEASSCYEKAFLIGSSVCHQIPSHSYHRDNLQFPMCARCSGLYLGSLIGITFFSLRGRKAGIPRKEWLVLLAACFFLWGVDGLNSLVSDFVDHPLIYATTNTTRLITGYGMGLVMSTALITLFNITAWKNAINQPLLDKFWQAFGYVGLSMISAFLLTRGGSFIFTVLAYTSLFSVLLIITLLYTIFWVIIFKCEGQFEKLSAMTPLLLAGFSTALIQIFLLNALRAQILV